MGGYGPGFAMMGGWGGSAMFPFGGIFGLLILALVIAAVVWLARALLRPRDPEPRAGQAAGLDVLNQRYARGEISRDEYLQKRADVLG